MKHIKTYENRNYKYQIGDYVFIKDGNKPNSYTVIVSRGNSVWPYMLETYDLDSGKIIERFPVDDSEIIRKLTPEEIELISIKKAAKKYNL